MAVVLFVVGSGSAQAQYFGRNKVRYDARDVRVLKTEHFDVHFDESAAPAAPLVGRMAERWHERLSELLDHRLEGRQPIVFYSGHPDFEQTNTIAGALPESVGGVTDASKRRVVLPSAGALAETDHVLGHELVHAFQYDIAGRGARIHSLPLWFIEGMAEYLTLGPMDAHTSMWMRDAVRSGRLPTVRQLDHPRFFPYRYGHAFWAYVGGRWGDDEVGRVLKAIRSSGGAVRALEKTLGVSEAELSRDWHAALREAYVVDDSDKDTGVPANAAVRGASASHLNLAPALSPDGTRLVFLSEQDGGSLELFLADAETGRVRRRLLKRRLDPHFESVQFIGSAGAWAPDGRRFAFAGGRNGRAVLTLLDADRGRIEREVDVPGVDEVMNPTWSPDGTRVAFSAKRRGFTDLFIYELASGRFEALTDDPYADLQPAWSPDGESIAFVTDRFGTDLEQLRWSGYRLAELALSSRTIEALPSFTNAKNVNPQWSGGALFFVSDRDGASNVYRLDVASGTIRQVTDVPVGLSGITSLSPVLATAASAQRLVVTAFGGGRYRLFSLKDACTLEGRPVDEREPLAPLPPQGREKSRVQELLADAAHGLPTQTAFTEQPYRARLSSDGFAEPYFSLGQSRFGMNVVGGGSLFWSDLLGDRRLSTGIMVNGGPKDVSGIVAYENRRRRWAWGVSLQQRALRTGAISWAFGEEDGRTVAREQLVRFREYDRVASARIGYPFARGRRLELSGGFRHVSFAAESEIRTSLFDTGERLGRRRMEISAPASLDLVELGAAFVEDQARFGPTGATEGSRMRFEIVPTLGEKSFLGIRLDYRRYVKPVAPLTLAGRLFHYGRYGRDAEDPRLAPLFTAYSGFVRGYEGLDDMRCRPGACQRIDDFVGSKVLVANFEARVPTFFFLGRARAFGPIPSELVFFFDGATAWRNSDATPLPGVSRGWIRSWGAGLRVNLLGLAIGELDYVRPLDLPGRSPMFRIRLGAGF